MTTETGVKIFKKIDKFYFSYKAVREYAMFLMRHFFYNSVNVYGLENIPKNKAYMIAPNHQNALMDAAVIIDAFQRPVFIARADLFSNKYLAKFIEWARMMPAYRIRDGKENLSKNEPIFRRSAEVLKNNIPIIIFPEAAHNSKRFLLPLKKGLARIAFQTEVVTDFTLDLVVIPAGIYYDNYENLLTNVTVVYGKPILVKDFKEEFLASDNKGINLFNKKLSEEIKKLIINIENVEYYESYEMMRHLYRDEMYKKVNLSEKNALNNLIADKELIKTLDILNTQKPDEMKALHLKVEEYSKGLKRLGFRDWQIKKQKISSFSLYLQLFLLIFLFPIHLFSYVNNFLPLLPQKLLLPKIKDRQFHSSIKYVLGVLIAPLIFVIQTIIISFLTDIWWIKWVYLIMLPISLYISLHYYKQFIKVRSSLQLVSLQKAKDTFLFKLITLRKEISEKLNEITSS